MSWMPLETQDKWFVHLHHIKWPVVLIAMGMHVGLWNQRRVRPRTATLNVFVLGDELSGMLGWVAWTTLETMPKCLFYGI